MATNNNKNCHIVSKVNNNGSSTKDNIFPTRVPQEVLNNILRSGLHLSDFRNLALTCKNIYEGIIPALYNRSTQMMALVHAARHGRVETLERMLQIEPNMRVDNDPYDTDTGKSCTVFISWPIQLPPKTTELIISINHRQPVMAKALIEAGADNRPGGWSHLVHPSPQLAPIHWLMERMAETTDAETMKQWKEVLAALLDIDAVACPDPDHPGRRQLSALAQSIHRRLPLDVTSMLIKKGNLGKKHMVSNSRYMLFGKKTMSPLNLAKQERDLIKDHPDLTGGNGRARLAMIRKVIYQKSKLVFSKMTSSDLWYRF